MLGLWKRVDKETDSKRRDQEMEQVVNHLIREELADLYEKLRPDEDRRSALKDFLLDLVERWPRFRDQDLLLPVDRLRQHTDKYLKAEWMHTPWITNQLLKQLIESTFEPLDREVKRVYIVRFVVSAISLAWFVGIYVLFILDRSTVAWLGVTLSLWHYMRRLIYRRRAFARITETYDNLVIVTEKIDGIVAELDEDSYSPLEVIRILHWVETKVETLYLPTMTYSLLRLRQKNMQAPMTSKSEVA